MKLRRLMRGSSGERWRGDGTTGWIKRGWKGGGVIKKRWRESRQFKDDKKRGKKERKGRYEKTERREA